MNELGPPSSEEKGDLQPEREGTWLTWRNRPWWTWPILWLALALILVYQRVISPFLGANCRFHPTCSRYTYLAILKYGVVRGVLKGARRISKCHPWHPGGVDYP